MRQGSRSPSSPRRFTRRAFTLVLAVCLCLLGWFAIELLCIDDPGEDASIKARSHKAVRQMNRHTRRLLETLVFGTADPGRPKPYLPPVSRDVPEEDARSAMELITAAYENTTNRFAFNVRDAGKRLETIEVQLEEADRQIRDEQWSQAAAITEDVQLLIADLVVEERKLRHARRGKASAEIAREMAFSSGLSTNDSSFWARVGERMARADALLKEGALSEAHELYQDVALIYTKADLFNDRLAEVETERQRVMESLEAGEWALLTNHGGAEWDAVQERLEMGASVDVSPTRRIAAYDAALRALPRAVREAETRTRMARHDDLLVKAQRAASTQDWPRAYALTREAAALPTEAYGPAFHLLTECAMKLPRAGLNPVEIPLSDQVVIRFSFAPAGSFTMGSVEGDTDETPPRAVTLTAPFWIGTYEITRAQLHALSPAGHVKQDVRMLPATGLTWDKAVRFCTDMGDRLGLRVRLPTEAEWEYACRAGSETRYAFGDDEGELHQYGNYCDEACALPYRSGDVKDGFAKLAPVGSYAPNPWGIYDMHGNVFEWCADAYDAAFYATGPAGDPRCDNAEATHRVLRGGCWQFGANLCRSSSRYRYLAQYGSDYIGLRIVIVPP